MGATGFLGARYRLTDCASPCTCFTSSFDASTAGVGAGGEGVTGSPGVDSNLTGTGLSIDSVTPSIGAGSFYY